MGNGRSRDLLRERKAIQRMEVGLCAGQGTGLKVPRHYIVPVFSGMWRWTSHM